MRSSNNSSNLYENKWRHSAISAKCLWPRHWPPQWNYPGQEQSLLTRPKISGQQQRMLWSPLTQTQQSSCLSVCKPGSRVLSWSLHSLQSHWETVRDDGLTRRPLMRDEAGTELERGMKTQSSAVTSNHSDISETINWVGLLSARLNWSGDTSLHTVISGFGHKHSHATTP